VIIIFVHPQMYHPIILLQCSCVGMVKETKDLSLDPKWSKIMVVVSYINQVISM